MTILIDADGCPVVDLTLQIAKQFDVPVIILCDTFHQIEREGVQTLVFDKGADSVDFALVNRVKPSDIVITQDYELASMCLPGVSDVMKNKTRCRTLPLIPAVEAELLKQKEKQQLYRRLFGKSYRTDYLNFVCTDQEGKLLRPNFVTEHFEWLLRQYGLPHIRFHDLRHSCASLMVMNGVSMKQIQEWLGHSDFSTTANIYAHLDYASKLSSAQAMLEGLGYDNASA